MPQDVSFNSISEALVYLIDTLSNSKLSDQDKASIAKIGREISRDLPSLQYAIDLFYDEPKLVTGKRELVIACGELYARVCEIDAIRNYGKWETDDMFETARTDLNIFRATTYLQRQLTRAHRNLCSARYR